MANTHSLDLEASSSQYAYIEDASQTGLDLSGDFTIEFWVKFESFPTAGTYSSLVGKLGQASGFSYGLQHFNNSGTIQISAFACASDVAIDQVTATYSFSTGIWYHVAVTCDISNATATEFEFYKDGVSLGNGSINTSATVNSLQNTSTEFAIGRRAGYTTLDGLIDEVRVWSVIRTDEQINAYKRRDVTGQSGLVAYWKLNNSALDETSNNNDLTVSGGTYSTTVPFTSYSPSGSFISLI